MKKRLYGLLLAICLLLCLAACGEAEDVSAGTAAPTEMTEAVPETTEVPPETTVSGLLENNVEDKVCVGLVPTTA